MRLFVSGEAPAPRSADRLVREIVAPLSTGRTRLSALLCCPTVLTAPTAKCRFDTPLAARVFSTSLNMNRRQNRRFRLNSIQPTSGWAAMTRLATSLILLTLLLTGCHTAIQAPGAFGKVVDADTGAAVHGAIITRPAVTGLWGFKWIPPERLPAMTIASDKRGAFSLPAATQTHIAHMYFPNPHEIHASFLISADGYATNELHGTATSRRGWRVDFGQVLLRRP